MEREQALQKLHTTAREFIRAEDPVHVAEIAVESMDSILGMPTNSVHFYDDESETLTPVAWTETTADVIGSIPAIPAGEGIAWEVFETGEKRHYDDVSTDDERYNETTDIRSEIILPLDSHGVILIGSTEPDVFSESDVWLAETVAAHLTTALDRIQRETQLQRERERFRALFETLPEPVAHVRFEGEPIVQDVNPAFEETFGHDASTVIGKSINDIIVPEDRQKEAKELDVRIKNEGTIREEIQREAADGMRDFLFTTVPVRTDGEVTECFGITFDITEQREYERQLEQQNERLDGFASIVSHDLRNPLNVVKGRLNHLQDQYEDDEHLDVALQSVDRMETLIHDLLTLAREGETISETSPVDLAEMIERSWDTIETPDATLVVESDLVFEADSNRTQELLGNLIRNALEHGHCENLAGNDTGLTITVGALEDDAGFFVEDDGCGIPSDVTEEVFESGFTTADDGTGYGLAIVDQIASAHGWETTVTEGTDGGARFEFRNVEVLD